MSDFSDIDISPSIGYPTINFENGFVIKPTAGEFMLYSLQTIHFEGQLAKHRKISLDFIPRMFSSFSNKPLSNPNFYMPMPLDFEVYIEG